MKISLVGYGKMGQIIKELAQDRGHLITTIDPLNSNSDYKEISQESVGDADICIDFSHPSVVLGNIEKLTSLKKNSVIGTTGWYDKIESVKELVKKNGVGLLYASNFSIGVNIFYQIVRNAARLINKIDAYDICGLEYHHNQKADSPSGTAQSLAKILIDEIDRKDKVVYDKMDRKIQPNELHFASVRCGAFPGTHEISFDSQADTISLKHIARSRQGFAYGAVLAAEWLKEKKGLFTIDDFIKSIL